MHNYLTVSVGQESELWLAESYTQVLYLQDWNQHVSQAVSYVKAQLGSIHFLAYSGCWQMSFAGLWLRVLASYWLWAGKYPQVLGFLLQPSSQTVTQDSLLFLSKLKVEVCLL